MTRYSESCMFGQHRKVQTSSCHPQVQLPGQLCPLEPRLPTPVGQQPPGGLTACSPPSRAPLDTSSLSRMNASLSLSPFPLPFKVKEFLMRQGWTTVSWKCHPSAQETEGEKGIPQFRTRGLEASPNKFTQTDGSLEKELGGGMRNQGCPIQQ